MISAITQIVHETMLPLHGYGRQLVTIEIVFVLQDILPDDEKGPKRQFCRNSGSHTRVSGHYDEAYESIITNK